MTEKLKCPICGKDLIDIDFGNRWFLACDNSKCRCKGVASYVVWEHIDRARKAMEQSEICCTEWEKQALDYKTENIALSGDLERTRKALDIAIHYLDAEYYAYIMVHKKEPELIAKVLAEIKTALEQKDK